MREHGLAVDHPKAFLELKVAEAVLASCELRQSKYLNNVVEQDHRVHQTPDQTRNGLLFVRDGLANIAGV